MSSSPMNHEIRRLLNEKHHITGHVHFHLPAGITHEDVSRTLAECYEQGRNVSTDRVYNILLKRDSVAPIHPLKVVEANPTQYLPDEIRKDAKENLLAQHVYLGYNTVMTELGRSITKALAQQYLDWYAYIVQVYENNV